MIGLGSDNKGCLTTDQINYINVVTNNKNVHPLTHHVVLDITQAGRDTLVNGQNQAGKTTNASPGKTNRQQTHRKN